MSQKDKLKSVKSAAPIGSGDGHMAQVVYCKCGSLFAACMEPLCYQDEDWIRDIKKYSIAGYTIKMVNPETVRVEFSYCKCEAQQMELAI